MTQNATQAKNSRYFAEQSVFGSIIPSSMDLSSLNFHNRTDIAHMTQQKTVFPSSIQDNSNGQFETGCTGLRH